MAGCEGPYLITAESSVGKIYSVATNEDVGNFVNVTPLTQVVAVRVLGTSSLENLDIDAEKAKVTKTKVDQSVSEIKSALSDLASAFDASSIDIRSGAFAADGSKLDKILDAISVQPDPTGLKIAVKGSTAAISVPSDSTAPLTGAIDAAAITEAEAAMTEFDSMKSKMLSGINACLAAKSETCYASFFHTNYKNDGMSVADEWEDIAWEGMDIQYINLTLINMNETKDEAWVAYTTREKEDDGTYRGWLGTNKLKKESGNWKIFGNQIPVKFRPQPSLIQDGALTNLKRGINFRYWDWGAIDHNFSFEFKSADLGATSAVTVVYSGVDTSVAPDSQGYYPTVDTEGLVYFTVGTGTPACAATNKHCKNFLVLDPQKSVVFPKYEITIDTVTYESYIPGLPSLPLNRDDAPKFSNLEHNALLCKTYSAVTDFQPQTLSWTLPSGFSVEGVNFNNQGGNYNNWNFNYDLDFGDTSSIFGSGIDAAAGFNIDKMQLRLELRDNLDRAFFLPYSCSI